MIAALVMTAAAIAAPGPDVYTDDEGCRWLKQEAPAAARTTAVRPFVVQFPKPKPPTAAKPKAKRKTYAKPATPPGYDAIGCDEGGPPPFSVLPPPEMSMAEFELVPSEVPPELVAAVEPAPQRLADVAAGPGAAGGSFVSLGGQPQLLPTIVVTHTLGVAAPVPEPSTWSLVLCAGMALLLLRRGHGALSHRA